MHVPITSIENLRMGCYVWQRMGNLSANEDDGSRIRARWRTGHRENARVAAKDCDPVSQRILKQDS